MAELPEESGTTPSSEPTYSSPAPPPFQPVATGTPSGLAPAKSGGSSALNIVLIIVAVFVVLGIGVAGVVGYGVWRVSRSIHSKLASAEKSIDLPSGGSVSVNSSKTYSASELGVEAYPGAEATSKGSSRITLPTGSMTMANFTTSDSKDKVVAFYKDKLGSEASTMETGDAAIVTAKKGNKEGVVVTITQKPDESDGKTQIHIMHTASTKDE